MYFRMFKCEGRKYDTCGGGATVLNQNTTFTLDLPLPRFPAAQESINMTDEWSMFGSDDEESDADDEPPITSGSAPHSSSAQAKQFMTSLEKSSDAIATQSTQIFLKMNRTVPLTQRYFGVVNYGNESANACGDEDEMMGMLSQSLSKKIQQRGMKVESFSSCLSEDDQDKAIFDGAANVCVFQQSENIDGEYKRALKLIPGNSEITLHQQESSSIRKKLALGGFLMVTTVIKHHIGHCENENNETNWTPKELLQQWKTTGARTDNKGEEVFSNAVWDMENATIIHHEREIANDAMANSFSIYTVCVTKRPCTVNTLSCLWKTNHRKVPQSYYDSSDDVKTEEKWIDFEHRILSNATIPQSVYEQNMGLLTRESIDRAVEALQTHGFVVLPGLFRNAPQQIQAIQEWSKAILRDFDSATDILKSKYNVDILNPGKGSDPLSYREMAMREDFRVDLRDGPNMKEFRTCMEGADKEVLECLGYKVMDGGEGTMPSIIDKKDGGDSQVKRNTMEKAQDKKTLGSLRYNPFILDIVRKLQNPHIKEDIHKDSNNQPLYKGNFGKWNFSGSGPNGSPQPIRIGQIGSVISLPGAADQCIHADTAHIFETHDCLPCHYANLFILGEDADDEAKLKEKNVDSDNNFTGDNLIGGTAFVAGSHRLSMTARLTADKGISAAGSEESTQNEMHMRTIRPSLQLGDAIIFDTRTLHFGLANRDSNGSSSSEVLGLRRPLLYVNLTHSWFFDPKNWDDKQSIFSD